MSEKGEIIEDFGYEVTKKEGVIEDIAPATDSKVELLTKAPVDVTEGSIRQVDVAEKWDEFNFKTISEDDILLIYSHMEDRTTAEWLEILRRLVEYHDDDECVPRKYRKFLASLLEGPLPNMTMEEWRTMVAFETFLIYEWSIYPEVRFVTRPIDEEDEDDYENLRTYIIGTIWACAGCTLDTFFEVRYPAITIDSGAVQLLICLSGQLWARLPRIVMPFPRVRIPYIGTTPSKLVVNSGHPWTFKEQTFAYLAMAVCLTSPYSQQAVISLANEHFLGMDEAKGFGFPVLLTLCTNFLGFGISGFFRAFCVYPTKMVWFDILPWLRLNRALVQTEVREKVSGWPFTSHEFFWLISWISFGWFWITNLVWASLSYFTWTSWMDPTDPVLQAVTGPFNGLGFNPIPTFDLNNIGFSCIYIPWKIQVITMAGLSIGTFALLVMWYTNVRYTGHLPINSNSLFDNTGQPYNLSRVVNANGTFVPELYQQYSAPYYTAGYLVAVGIELAMLPGMFVYSILAYGKMIRTSFNNIAKGSWTGQGEMNWKDSVKMVIKGMLVPGDVLQQFDTRFTRAMAKYPETPESWYLVMFVISIVLCLVFFGIYDFLELNWVWSVFLALGFTLVFVYPDNVLRARTTGGFSVSTLLEIICGFAMKSSDPSQSIKSATGVIIGRTFAITTMSQTDNWVNQLAMANYVGIAQRSLFRVQIVSMVCVSLVEAGLISWQTSGAVKNMCENPDGARKFTCPDEKTFFNAGIQYGMIGPNIVFNDLYPSLKYVFLFGALYPVPFWLGRRYFGKIADKFRPGSWMNRIFHGANIFLKDYVNEMMLLSGASGWAPSNWWYQLPNFEMGLFLRKWVEPRYPRWWAKYAFVMYSAIFVGVAFGGLFNFFATQYNHIVDLNWGGNSIYTTTNDYNGVNLSYHSVPAVGYFGPPPGQIPI